MRYLQIVTLVLFLFSLVFSGWASNRFFSTQNTDMPTITSDTTQLQLSVDAPPEAIFQDLHAQDATDGDLTDQILVASVSHFFEPGTVNVKYVVFDSHNNSATLTRQVHYTDYTSPVFSLDKSPIYTVGSSFDLLEHIQVNDCLDGDISEQVRVISNTVNNFSTGNYPVVLEVSNSCGDTAQLTLWVSYISKENTASVKLHQYIVYAQQGDTFDPYRWIASVADRDAVALDPENIEIQGNLDMNKPGSYQLIYNYSDGRLSGQASLTVVVTERQA